MDAVPRCVLVSKLGVAQHPWWRRRRASFQSSPPAQPTFLLVGTAEDIHHDLTITNIFLVTTGTEESPTYLKMSSEPRFRTYRLSGIPPGTSNDIVRAWFPAQEQATIQRITQAQSLSDLDDKKDERLRVATITFSEPPPSLDAVQPLASKFDLAKLVSPLNANFSAVQIDAHFLGMTPLSDPSGAVDAVE